MTPACIYLDKKKIAYTIHEYHHDPAAEQFGLEAAEKLNLAPETVFKTLLVTDDKQLFVTIIPVTHTLNLKKAAKACGVKKVKMADPKVAEKSSGYLVGGISPIAQKKSLPTFVDQSAEKLVSIYISGGKRGLDIGLKPNDLLKACHPAKLADLKDD
ncbi:Cys-tRNA(Pro) deacylase [Marinomonas agarivorans]|nr:Cys-tRNA(Pro) deacylase [Marinomonas agarivorans]